MKPKIFKKLTEHGFSDWVAAITGDIGEPTETGFELVNASVQVFERKPRETDAPAEAEAKAAAEPKPAAPAQPKPTVAELEKGKAEAGKDQVKPKKVRFVGDEPRYSVRK